MWITLSHDLQWNIFKICSLKNNYIFTTPNYRLSWQWEENSWEFVRFAFDHQPRNEKAKNTSTFTAIDVLIPGDPAKLGEATAETIYKHVFVRKQSY